MANQSLSPGVYSVADAPTLDVGREYGSTGRIEVTTGGTFDITQHGPGTDGYAPGNGVYYSPQARLGRDGGSEAAVSGDGASGS